MKKQRDKNVEFEDFELYIRKNEKKLMIGFKDNGCWNELGWIGNDGRCHFQTKEHQHEKWEVWKENGFKVAEQILLVWKGLAWYICSNGKLVTGDPNRLYHRDDIYYFSDNSRVKYIYYDNNFLKKDSDNRILLY